MIVYPECRHCRILFCFVKPNYSGPHPSACQLINRDLTGIVIYCCSLHVFTDTAAINTYKMERYFSTYKKNYSFTAADT
jgi:hypothetical protein